VAKYSIITGTQRGLGWVHSIIISTQTYIGLFVVVYGCLIVVRQGICIGVGALHLYVLGIALVGVYLCLAHCIYIGMVWIETYQL